MRQIHGREKIRGTAVAKAKPTVLAVLLLAALLVPARGYAAEGLGVGFDDLQVNKSTKAGSSWNFMDLNLSLSGDRIKEVKWYYDPVFTRMGTESKNFLKGDEDRTGRRVFDLKAASGSGGQRLWERINELPARSDENLYVEGYVEVYTGTDERGVAVIDNYLERSGKPVDHPLLKGLGVEMTYMTKDDMVEYQKKQEQEREQRLKRRQDEDASPESLGKAMGEALGELFSGFFSFGDADLTYVIGGAKDKVLNVVLVDEKGEEIKTSSRSLSRSGEEGAIVLGVDYEKMLPYKGRLKVYLDDGKGLKKVYFKHKIPLP